MRERLLLKPDSLGFLLKCDTNVVDGILIQLDSHFSCGAGQERPSSIAKMQITSGCGDAWYRKLHRQGEIKKLASGRRVSQPANSGCQKEKRYTFHILYVVWCLHHVFVWTFCILL